MSLTLSILAQSDRLRAAADHDNARDRVARVPGALQLAWADTDLIAQGERELVLFQHDVQDALGDVERVVAGALRQPLVRVLEVVGDHFGAGRLEIWSDLGGHLDHRGSKVGPIAARRVVRGDDSRVVRGA